MPGPGSEISELSYPLRAAARLTGLSPELLRAWERRYRAVIPRRTPGGTRRYSARDLERLRLLKAAVDAGHRIGAVAGLDDAELMRRAAAGAPAAVPLDPPLAAIARLDAPEAQRLLATQLAALGPLGFAKQVAIPLLHEVGTRWADGRLRVSHEHLASSLLRTLLGSALQPSTHAQLGPRIVFATPEGERHELGLLAAALTVLSAGANPIYLGAEVPTEDLLDAVRDSRADAVALSIVCLARTPAKRAVAALGIELAPGVQFWVGGAAARDLPLTPPAEHLETLDELERRAVLLGSAGARVG